MRIQIYEGSKEGYLDITGKSPAMFNMSMDDIKDVAKLGGNYSNTLSISNTKEAQEILGHIFSVHVSAETGIIFDTRKKIKCALVENGAVFQDNLNLQLKEVQVSKWNIIGYSIEVYDDKAELFNKMNNALLTDLDFSDGDHVLTREHVHETFAREDATDGIYKYHLSTTNGNTYGLNQFKPAIFVSEYIRRATQSAGIELEIVDSDLVKFDRCIVPCTRKVSAPAEPIIVQERTIDTANNVILNTIEAYNQAPNLSTKIIFPTEIYDIKSAYNDTTGAFEPFVNFPAGQAVNFKIDFTAELEIKNTTTNALTQVARLSTAPNQDDRLAMRFYLKKNNINAYGIAYKDSTPWITIPKTETLSSLEQAYIGEGSGSVTLVAGSMLTTDDIFQHFASCWTPSGRWNKWVKGSGQEVAVQHIVKITSATITISANTDGGFFIGNVIRLNDYVPEKMKQSDLLKSIVTLNNMWAIKTGENKFQLIRRTEYLESGETKDWSDKLEHDKYTLSEISELTNKKMLFSYKGDQDTLNKAYTDTTAEVFGQFEFTFDSEHVRQEKKVEIPISPTPMHQTNFGAVVPAIEMIDPKANVRLLVNGDVQPCGSFSITSPGIAEYVISDGYPFVGHTDHPFEPTIDLNFGVCDYYFYPQTRLTNNNMFNLNWRGVCYQINRGRLLKGLFNLSITDIYNFKFSDKIHCLGQDWHVNLIKANLNRKEGEGNYLAIVELITAQETDKVEASQINTGGLIPGPRKPKLPGIPIRDGLTNGILTDFVREVTKKNNTFLNPSGGNVQVQGENNTIYEGVDNALIVANGKEITENGLWLQNFGIKEDGTIVPPYKAIFAGFNTVLHLGGARVPFQVVTAGVDTVLDLGGEKTFQTTEGLKVMRKLKSGDGGFILAPNEDYETFEDWENDSIGVGEIGINITSGIAYFSDGTNIVRL